MAMPVVERAMLDTNVLLAATATGRSEHDAATEVLNFWPRNGTVLYASGQILREYFAVATRPKNVNGLGLTRTDTIANLAAFAGRVTILDEDERVRARLWDILGAVECGDKQVHDANIVATMLVGGITTLVTANTADFVRFADQIVALDLLDP